MEETLTNFTVVKESVVYVVRKVPTLECPQCGSVSFRQDVAKKLEKLTSGRSLPVRPSITAWTYDFGDPILEASQILPSQGTHKISLCTFVSSKVDVDMVFTA